MQFLLFILFLSVNAKVQVKVQLSKNEIQQIEYIENIDLQTDENRSSTFIRRLMSSPFTNRSLLKIIFQAQNFERLRSFNSSINLIENQSISTNMTNSINIINDEVVQTNDPTYTVFHGTQFREKFSFNLRMYSDEIQKWIQ